MNNAAIDDQPNSTGVLWSYHLNGHGGGLAAETGTINGTSTDEGFHWHHLKCDEPDAVAWLRSQSLDSNVVEALTETETRPRVMAIADGMLVVLRGVNTNVGSDPEDMVSVRFWFTKKLVVSTRRRKLLSVVDVRDSIEGGKAPRTPAELVAVIIERLADRIGITVDAIDDELTKVEDDLVEHKTSVNRRHLSELRRQIASLRRYLAPQREALTTLLRSRDVFGDEEMHALHIEADRITRYVEDLDLARERTLLLQEELQNRIAEEQNARMYILSIVATIFLPLSFLTGVFGMNVAGLPGTENSSAFGFLAGGMVATGVAIVIAMRFKRWL